MGKQIPQVRLRYQNPFLCGPRGNIKLHEQLLIKIKLHFYLSTLIRIIENSGVLYLFTLELHKDKQHTKMSSLETVRWLLRTWKQWLTERILLSGRPPRSLLKWGDCVEAKAEPSQMEALQLNLQRLKCTVSTCHVHLE